MPANLSTSASRVKVKTTAENLLFGIDFTKLLQSGETLTGTPTIRNQPTGLTFGGPLVNVAQFNNDDGGIVAIGAGVQVRISGGAVRSGTAQGGSLNTIQFDSGASQVNDAYDGLTVSITGGTGDGQPPQRIGSAPGSYVGSTVTATMAGNWQVPPDNTTQFTISGWFYTFVVQCATTAGNTREVVVTLQVVDK